MIILRPAGQGDITKQKIVDGAVQLFSKKGYTATSIEDIRKFIGISKGNIYTHFSSKDELYAYALDLSVKQCLLEVEQEMNHLQSATAKLYALADYYAKDVDFGIVRTVPEYIATVGAEEFKLKAEGSLKQEVDLFSNILKEGAENGEFNITNIEECTLYLYTLFTNLVITRYLLGNEEHLDKAYKYSVDLFLNGIK